MNNLNKLIEKSRLNPALAPIYAVEFDRQLRALNKAPFTFAATDFAEGAVGVARELGLDKLFEIHSNRKDGGTIFKAEMLAKDGRRSEAISHAFANARGSEVNALNLLYANHSTKNTQLRLHFLNKYLYDYGLEVELEGPETAHFFHRIQSKKNSNNVDGPLVTVIMPVHNSEQTIELALRSLLNQTWCNLQIIVIDDASNDSTLQKTKKMAKLDPRIEVMSSPINVGPYVCRNLGVLHARGYWLTVHDADDWAFPDRIEQQVKALSSSNSLACTGLMLRMNEQGQITRPLAGASSAEDGYLRLCFVSLMVQTSYFRKVLGSWDSVRVSGDAEMIDRLGVLATKKIHLRRPLMLCLDRQEGLTNNQEFGLLSESGQIHPLRAAYKLAFSDWHKTKNSKKISPFAEGHPFEAPRAILINQSAIKKVFATWKKNLELIKATDLFDEAWYLKQYHTVDQTGLQPAEHYLVHGVADTTNPNPNFNTQFYLKTRATKINPLLHYLRGKDLGANPKRVLFASSELAKFGMHEQAIALAEANLSKELAYTVNILKANESLGKNDEVGWQKHLNAYLAHFNVAPICLDYGEGVIFDRLGTAPLPTVIDGPLVTVIMPAWNCEKTVRKAVKSILNQTWRNLELIIVDDSSTDGTWAILQEISSIDIRVKIYRNNVNVGPYVSKNIALQFATGQWFTGHDADDWAHPTRLERHMRHLLSSNTFIPASRAFMIRMDLEGVFTGISFVSSEKIDGIFQNCAISTIFNMDFFRTELGAYDCARFGADNELVGRLQLITGRDIDTCNHLAMICLSLPGSLTNNSYFGVGSNYAQTPGRIAYKTAWQSAHTKLGNGRWTRYSFPPSEASSESLPFIKPPIADVSIESINLALGRQGDCISKNTSKNIFLKHDLKPIKVLRRIVFVLNDISTIGGIPNRTRIVLDHAVKRDVIFQAITRNNEFGHSSSNVYCIAEQPDFLHAELATWLPQDTVFVVTGNNLRLFPSDVVDRIEQFPIVYFSAGQLAFFVQNSPVLLDLDYVERFRVTKIISLSEGDIHFQQQLGIFGQIKGSVPVAQRTVNNYDPVRNRKLGYVGRIDFNSKDCMKLIDVARAMKGTQWMPIQVFTTDGKNSPEYTVFRKAVTDADLDNQFEFTINCTEKDRIYSEIAVLLLPSKMEAFGNVVVEAFSYGIPVIATNYAPGPAEIIHDAHSGYLLNSYTGEAVRRLLENLSYEFRIQMSNAAFSRHKDYSLENHVNFLEGVCTEALGEFEGQNLHPVFPVLKIAEVAEKKIARISKKLVSS